MIAAQITSYRRITHETNGKVNKCNISKIIDLPRKHHSINKVLCVIWLERKEWKK